MIIASHDVRPVEIANSHLFVSKPKAVGQLSAGGTTTMPLQKQVWGDEFGMCLDQFGVSWLVNISQP